MAKPKSPVKAGDLLAGKYRVERMLGVGGMGMVVAAKHIELNTRVALKMLLPEIADDEQVARFQREARAAVRLRSEHSVRVLDVGKMKDGTPFMVMELLIGRDLGALVLERGLIPPHDAVDFIIQACEAVAEAHAMGIVHRDLKPRNLFLTTRADGSPLVKVLDFGLAKSLHQRQEDMSLTKTSAILGSPMYMSPEQMRSTRDVDTRTDIWSLGVCLYELVTGRAPFEAPTVAELCALVLTADPRPPHEVNPNVPVELSKVIVRCLQKTAEARFDNVGELAFVLQEFGSPTSRAAADRVMSVLHTTSPEHPSDHPPGSEPFGSRTAATWDSGARRDGLGSNTVLAIAAGSLIALSLFGFSAWVMRGTWFGHAVEIPPATAAATSPSPSPPDLPLATETPSAISTLAPPAIASIGASADTNASARPRPFVKPPASAASAAIVKRPKNDAGANDSNSKKF
jgi:eukaryotic-like serine/threonine-protein kinase